MGKQKAGLPAIVGAVVVVIVLLVVLWRQFMTPAAVVLKGTEIQTPSNTPSDPSQLPPGGPMTPNGPANGSPGKTLAMPPGKKSH